MDVKRPAKTRSEEGWPWARRCESAFESERLRPDRIIRWETFQRGADQI